MRQNNLKAIVFRAYYEDMIVALPWEKSCGNNIKLYELRHHKKEPQLHICEAASFRHKFMVVEIPIYLT